MRRPTAAAGSLLAAALVVIGCESSPGPGAMHLLGPRPAPVAPSASSAVGAVGRLEWCWNHLDLGTYRSVFGDDYVFAFSASDPDGGPYRGTPWTREDELACFTHLVSGGDANQPAAQQVSLSFDRALTAVPDPRPGKTWPWHQFVRTRLALRVVAGGAEREITGYANFFLTRGDSTSNAEDLAAEGIRPDSTRWYVERWEDDTFQATGMRTSPTQKPTWGSLKALYR